MKFIAYTLLAAGFIAQVSAQVELVLGCSEAEMELHVPRTGIKEITVDNFRVFSKCQPIISKEKLFFKFNLQPTPHCVDSSPKETNTDKPNDNHHRLLITSSDGAEQEMKMKCPGMLDSSSRNRFKRNVLPAGFREPDYIEITKEITDSAPIPKLSVGVRQDGIFIGDSVTVSPGAELTMEVRLDDSSSEVYGIRVSYLMVTDNFEKNETIIYNGCTQDQYVFQNFKTEQGDVLEANFRAFKFPGSSYLLFKGTVDVCLDKCLPIRCSNGEMGYGKRRRREVMQVDPNKIFEASMTTLIRVEEDGDKEAEEIFNLIQRMRNSRMDQDLSGGEEHHSDTSRVSFTLYDLESSGSPLVRNSCGFTSLFVCLISVIILTFNL